MSRADIARELKLSKPTVSKAVYSLLKEGLLKETGYDKSNGGKRGMLLDFNSEGGLIVGIYVGASGIIFALSDLSAKIIKRKHCPLVCGEEAVNFLSSQIHDLIVNEEPSLKLRGIGMAVAALTDAAQGVVKAARYLPGWEGLEIQNSLEEIYDVPVAVDNDVVMAIIGEHSHGIARGVDDVIMFTFGDALALGIIINGQIYRGRHYAAGEIGDMVIDKGVYYNNTDERGGYLERHAGWGVLKKKIKHMVKGEKGLNNYTKIGIGEEEGNEGELLRRAFEKAAMDSQFAERLLKENWIDTGLAIANIVSVIDPSLVVLGGEINIAPQMYINKMKEVIDSVVQFTPDIGISILGRDAELLGSIATAIERLQNRITVSSNQFSL